MSRPLRVRGAGVKGQESNPHVWLDPRLASHAVKNILSALQKADPLHAARYATNAESYLKKLEDLDAELRQFLQPVRDKPFVTSHDAYAYFVQRYELRLAGVVERVPDIEPSPRELANLYQTIREKKATVIFAEPQFSSKLVRQMARDLGLEVAELDPMETGEPTASAYEEGMRRIAGTLLKHLK